MSQGYVDLGRLEANLVEDYDPEDLPLLRALIAELRASRKVVEAARDIDAWHWPVDRESRSRLHRLAIALAELSSINDVITEGK